jgi:hypothetical protein
VEEAVPDTNGGVADGCRGAGDLGRDLEGLVEVIAVDHGIILTPDGGCRHP